MDRKRHEQIFRRHFQTKTRRIQNSEHSPYREDHIGECESAGSSYFLDWQQLGKRVEELQDGEALGKRLLAEPVGKRETGKGGHRLQKETNK